MRGVPAHLSVVTLGVADVARARAFYESIGWAARDGSDDSISFFQIGPVVLGLFGRGPLAADAGVPDQPTGFAAVTLAINLADAALVDAAIEAWRNAGGSVVKAAHVADWGGYSGYVADVDGHLWEIAHNPYAPEWAAPAT
jgi:predicted lactoylglutathione lyase